MTNDILIFDKAVQCLKKARAKKYWSEHNFLHQFASKDLKERLCVINREFNNTLILDETLRTDEILSLDTEESFDHITSVLALHNINDLPGLLIQIRQALKADGLFTACLFGGETLYELRDCLQQAEIEITGGMTPRIHPFADKQDIGALMQRAGYTLPVIDSERLTVTYDNIFKLMHDLRYMGEGNILHTRLKNFTRRNIFMKANEIYAKKYSDKSGRLEASFEIIFTLGWAPHESQQQPLKPGSAEQRMSDALNSTEEKLPC